MRHYKVKLVLFYWGLIKKKKTEDPSKELGAEFFQEENLAEMLIQFFI